MFEKLISIFLSATTNVKSKRLIEWMVSDFIYTVYFMLVFCAFFSFVLFKGWVAVLITSVVFVLVSWLWSWVSYHIRLTLLNMLYPTVERTDENGDAMNDEDKYMKQLFDIINDLKVELEK